jgi:hypothetical protein
MPSLPHPARDRALALCVRPCRLRLLPDRHIVFVIRPALTAVGITSEYLVPPVMGLALELRFIELSLGMLVPTAGIN